MDLFTAIAEGARPHTAREVRLYHVGFISNGRNHTRQEYATSYNEAKDQAAQWFSMFGSGDEIIFYVDKI